MGLRCVTGSLGSSRWVPDGVVRSLEYWRREGVGWGEVGVESRKRR